MQTVTLAILAISNLAFLAAGFRMGRGLSPIPSPQSLWQNVRTFVSPTKPTDTPEPKPIPQEKF